MRATIPIYGRIDDGFAECFREALDDVIRGGATELLVPIDSNGGELEPAVSIVSAIIESGIHVTAVVERHAASAATFIAAWCDATAARPGAELLVHRVRLLNEVDWTAKELGEYVAELRREDDLLFDAYQRKTGLPRSAIDRLLDRGERKEWLGADECLKLGLVDQIVPWEEDVPSRLTVERRPSTPASLRSAVATRSNSRAGDKRGIASTSSNRAREVNSGGTVQLSAEDLARVMANRDGVISFMSRLKAAGASVLPGGMILTHGAVHRPGLFAGAVVI